MLDEHSTLSLKETWLKIRKNISQKKYTQALSLSEKIITFDAPADLINDHIQILLKLNHLHQAKIFLERLLQCPGSKNQAYLLLGHLYFKSEKWDQCSHYYQKLLALEPENIHALYNLGLVQSHLGHFDSACHFFKRVEFISKLLPPSFYQNYAMAFIYTQQIPQAQIYLEKRLEIAEPDCEILFHLGLTYQIQGDLKKAFETYEQALKLNALHAPSLHNFATTAMSLSKHEQAKVALEKLHHLHPNDVIVKTLYDALHEKQLTSHDTLFIQTLFDQYAFNYDQHLTQTLNYNPFKKAREMIQEHAQIDKFQCALTLDLGCGSGLAAPYFVDLSFRLIGVDLSAGMLMQAERKQAYETLVQKDILDYVRQTTLSPKLVLAFEVSNYLGKRVEALLQMLSEKMLPGGYVLFTFEKNKENHDDLFLNKQVRFSFSQPYIEEIMNIRKFRLIQLETIDLRVEDKSTVQGFIALSQII